MQLCPLRNVCQTLTPNSAFSESLSAEGDVVSRSEALQSRTWVTVERRKGLVRKTVKEKWPPVTD